MVLLPFIIFCLHTLLKFLLSYCWLRSSQIKFDDIFTMFTVHCTISLTIYYKVYRHSLVIVGVQVSSVSNGKLYQTDCRYCVYVKILQLRCYTIFFYDIILPSWKQINCRARTLSITNIRASARRIYLKILTNSKYNTNRELKSWLAATGDCQRVYNFI